MRTLLALALLTGLADPQPATTAAVTITNNGDRPCAVAARPDGAVQVRDGKRDGVALTPARSTVRYVEDLGAMIVRDAVQLAPGEQRKIPLNTVEESGAKTLVSVAPDLTATRWPTQQPGTYEFTLAYGFPAVPGAPENA